MSNQAIKTLLDPQTIRERAKQLYQRALNGESNYFSVNLAQLKPCCDFILNLAKECYPNLNVPFHSRWRHFEMDGIDRIAALQQHPQFPSTSLEQGKLYYELIIISVLLDAGAGPNWHYIESKTNLRYQRSEGLAVASLDMYQAGYFSSKNSLTADIEGLAKLTPEKIGQGMQVSDENPLLGLDGRSKLISSLALVIQNHPNVFANQRLGDLYQYVIEMATPEKTIDAAKVLHIVLQCFSEIWPGRISIEDVNLGDVWQHSAVQGEGQTKGLIPFHKLSQWLSYSLLEPLQWQGYQITNLEKLTGLAEYRNGGLLIDFDLLQVKQQSMLEAPMKPDSEAIIEWRALTICLLDELWLYALQTTNQTASDFPLVAFLQAGTWSAGRAIAQTKRADGGPPINIISDGTVF